MPTDEINPFQGLLTEETLIQSSDEANEGKFLELIAQRVEELMDEDMSLLLSYLYRLDIDEDRIDYILNKQMLIPPPMGLAELILKRQKQRILSKSQYKQDDISGWDTW